MEIQEKTVSTKKGENNIPGEAKGDPDGKTGVNLACGFREAEAKDFVRSAFQCFCLPNNR